MPIAFKEWAVTVRALAEGEQLITLRKGGIREPGKPFRLTHARFFLYPTFDHQAGDLVRESHQPELRRALEEGVWSEGEPPLNAFTSGAPVQQPDRVRIRAWAEVAHQFTVADPEEWVSLVFLLAVHWTFYTVAEQTLHPMRREILCR